MSVSYTHLYADGEGEWHHKEFNDVYTGRQTVSFTAKPRRQGVEVEYVGVYMVYRNNANSIDFYRAMLNVDMTGATYDYDSEGNLISAEDNADRNQAYSYSDANELLETVDAKNERYSYCLLYTSRRPTATTTGTRTCWGA